MFLTLGAWLSSSVFVDNSKQQKPGHQHALDRVVEATVGPGETLLGALRKIGLDVPTAHAMIDTLRPFVNLRKIKPGQNIQVVLDPEETHAKGLRYSLSKMMVELELTDQGWSAQTREIPSVNETRVIRGVVQESLYQSGIEAGLTPVQIQNLAEIFEYDVDFFSDFRQNDAFGVVFEEVLYADGRTERERILSAHLTARHEPFFAFHYHSDGRDGYFDLHGRSLGRAFLRAPLSYHRISSRFSLNRRHPIFRTVRPHRAIDYAAPAGTPVVSIGRGTANFVGRRGGYGNLVEIHHGNGYRTRYAHFSQIASGLRKGKQVARGEVIGYVGQTGHATGPHLHFEMLRAGENIDFLALRSPRGRQLAGDDLIEFTGLRDAHLALLGNGNFGLAESGS